jgi:hypothetical protein
MNGTELQRHFDEPARALATREQLVAAFPNLTPKGDTMTAEKRVERAAAKRAAARAEFESSIVAARESGLSLAAIAKSSGLSVEGVRKITQRQS